MPFQRNLGGGKGRGWGCSCSTGAKELQPKSDHKKKEILSQTKESKREGKISFQTNESYTDNEVASSPL